MSIVFAIIFKVQSEMSLVYLHEEHAHMYFCYGVLGVSQCISFQRRYPYREIFVRVHRVLRSRGSFNIMRDHQCPVAHQRDRDSDILQILKIILNVNIENLVTMYRVSQKPTSSLDLLMTFKYHNMT